MTSLEEANLTRNACDVSTLTNLLQNASTVEPAIQSVEVQTATIIRYKPGKRCLIKYGGVDARGNAFAMLGKIRFKGLDRASPKTQRLLRDQGLDGREGCCVPCVYGELPALNMWLQEFVENTATLSIESESFVSDQTSVALALAKLHRVSIYSARQYMVDDELRLLLNRFHQMKIDFPELRCLVEDLKTFVQKLAQEIVRHPSDHTTIHRDFYFDQVLISKFWTVLVDFDLCCIGPPELDVGNYIGHLREYGLRFPKRAQACREAEVLFLNTYFAATQQASRTATEAWAKLTLARHVALSTLLPGRSHTTMALANLLLALEV